MADDDPVAWALTIVIFIGLLLLALCVLFYPGMLLVALITINRAPKLDAGQTWVFSILASLGMPLCFFGARVAVHRIKAKIWDFTGNWIMEAGIGYLVVAGTLAIVALIAYFGFHVKFFGIAVARAFGY